MLDSIRDILLEAYRFTNGKEVMQAIAAKQIGVKIDPSFFDEQGSLVTRITFEKFFEKCNQMGVKDTVYGVQILCSKCTRQTLLSAVKNDGLYEFLKSYRKPWVKQLPEYKQFMNNKFNPDLWHDFEKAVQSQQSNHGNAAKGSGQLKDVKELYNDGTWRLLVPTSFEGEKAAAFYIDNGKETPTAWCTRCDRQYYDHYTQYGPLFIIRNMKNGRSYQLAFMRNGIEFLDQDDVNGDEITQGDLTAIPDNLLKLIKDPRKSDGNTLLDYKKASSDVAKKIPEKKGYLTGEITNGSPRNAKFGKPVSLGDGVMKKEILNYSDESPKNFMKYWFGLKDGEYQRKQVKFDTNKLYAKKRKATAYYLEKHPDAMWIYRTSTGNDSNKPILDGSIITTGGFNDLSQEEKNKIEEYANKDFGYITSGNRFDKKKLNEKRSLEKYNDKFDSQNYFNDFVDKVAKRIDFSKSKIFGSLEGMNVPRFYKSIDGKIYGETVINGISFGLKHEFKVVNGIKSDDTATVMFRKRVSEDEDDYYDSDGPYKTLVLDKDGVIKQESKEGSDPRYLTNGTLLDYTDIVAVISRGTGYILTGDEAAFVKTVAKELQKEIIKDKDYNLLNQKRRQERGGKLYEEVNYFNY